MYYNTKSLVREKVLQQYYYQSFMTGNASIRRKLLPEKFKHYSDPKNTGGLNPEVNKGGHIPDFVLYGKKDLPELNIEIKWGQLNNVEERIPYYNGNKGLGFWVCLETENNKNLSTVGDTDIPLVKIKPNDFIRWFRSNSHAIISQTLAKKNICEIQRITGPKYWVIYLADSALSNFEKGKKNKIWALRNSTKMGNLIQVLQGDYVIFVTISEMCSGDKKRGKFNPRSIRPYGDGIYDWKTHISIAKVISGYEPNFSSKPSKYKTFEREDWDGEPGTKVFTQFFGIEINANDTYCRDGMQKPGIPRKLFHKSISEYSEFTKAIQKSLTSRDIIEVSEMVFHKLVDEVLID